MTDRMERTDRIERTDQAIVQANNQAAFNINEYLMDIGDFVNDREAKLFIKISTEYIPELLKCHDDNLLTSVRANTGYYITPLHLIKEFNRVFIETYGGDKNWKNNVFNKISNSKKVFVRPLWRPNDMGGWPQQGWGEFIACSFREKLKDYGPIETFDTYKNEDGIIYLVEYQDIETANLLKKNERLYFEFVTLKVSVQLEPFEEYMLSGCKKMNSYYI